jgi:hypothetical protein
MRRLIPALGAMTLITVMAGCGSSDSESISSEAAPSTTEAAGVNVIEVQFDGVECSVSRESVAAGDWAFVVTNASAFEVGPEELYVNHMPDGYTFPDIVALQTEVGGPPNVVPDSEWNVVYEAGAEPISFASPPDIELASNQFLQMRKLAAGSDFVELYIYDPPVDAQWICSPPITVLP